MVDTSKNLFSSRRFTEASPWEIFRPLGLSTNAYSQMPILDFQIFLHLSKIMWNIFSNSTGSITAQKMKFSITDFFSKCDQICSFLWIWSHLLKKSLMENFIFCAVYSSPDSNHFTICRKFNNSFHAAIVSSIFCDFYLISNVSPLISDVSKNISRKTLSRLLLLGRAHRVTLLTIALSQK